MRTAWPLLLYYLLPLLGLWAVRRPGRVSAIVALGSWVSASVALGGLVASSPAPTASFLFYAFSLIALVAAFLVVTGRNPVYGALWLIGTFLGVAGVFIVLQAEFLGIIQVILYAGAILVLYLFVVMMVDIPREAGEPALGLKGTVAAAIGIVLLVLVVQALSPLAGRESVTVGAPVPAQPYSVDAVGAALFGRYLVPFEVASLVLLVALVGAIVLCKRGTEA
jgi:NADH-quinone oxidoreductase subunit J